MPSLPAAHRRGAHSDRPSDLLLCEPKGLPLSPEICGDSTQAPPRRPRLVGPEAPVGATPRNVDEHFVDKPVLERPGEPGPRASGDLRRAARTALCGRCPGAGPRRRGSREPGRVHRRCCPASLLEHLADLWVPCGRDLGRPGFPASDGPDGNSELVRRALLASALPPCVELGAPRRRDRMAPGRRRPGH